MDIRKFCKKRLHVEVEASEASDATATATECLHLALQRTAHSRCWLRLGKNSLCRYDLTIRLIIIIIIIIILYVT